MWDFRVLGQRTLNCRSILELLAAEKSFSMALGGPGSWYSITGRRAALVQELPAFLGATVAR